jgi:hypothetical protein
MIISENFEVGIYRRVISCIDMSLNNLKSKIPRDIVSVCGEAYHTCLFPQNLTSDLFSPHSTFKITKTSHDLPCCYVYVSEGSVYLLRHPVRVLSMCLSVFFSDKESIMTGTGH